MPRITTALNIYLTPEQISGLDGAAKNQGISRAELVRRIVDKYLAGAQPYEVSIVDMRSQVEVKKK